VSDLARLAGFEPATRCLEGSCSIRLSYRRLPNVLCSIQVTQRPHRLDNGHDRDLAGMRAGPVRLFFRGGRWGSPGSRGAAILWVVPPAAHLGPTTGPAPTGHAALPTATPRSCPASP